MPTTFRAYQPDQPLLLPPDLQEWVRWPREIGQVAKVYSTV